MMRKTAIRRAFGAALRYDDQGHIQRDVAGSLASRIAADTPRSQAHILEIGCGTGFLTDALINRGISGSWTITDLSHAMVVRCRDIVGDRVDARYLAMDGEHPCFADEVRFDLICSSLAFQWFDDLGQSISRLAEMIAPGGRLAFTTMAAGSFTEWRQAHESCGFEAATPSYPSVSEIASLAPTGFKGEVTEFELRHEFADGRAFLDHLKGIGAHVPRSGTRPLSAGAFRKVVRAFEATGSAATYHIACCVFSRSD